MGAAARTEATSNPTTRKSSKRRPAVEAGDESKPARAEPPAIRIANEDDEAEYLQADLDRLLERALVALVAAKSKAKAWQRNRA